MTPEAWFAALAAQLPDAKIVSSAEREALLDLARVAAHTSERWTAPVTTFLVGEALAGLDPSERVGRVRQLVAALDTPSEP